MQAVYVQLLVGKINGALRLKQLEKDFKPIIRLVGLTDFSCEATFSLLHSLF